MTIPLTALEAAHRQEQAAAVTLLSAAGGASVRGTGSSAATATQLSSTQSALQLAPEVASISHWDCGPAVYEVFPYQQQAIEFAAWCNAAGPERVARLNAICKPINFGSAAQRWDKFRALMQELGVVELEAQPPGDAAAQQQHGAVPSGLTLGAQAAEVPPSAACDTDTLAHGVPGAAAVGDGAQDAVGGLPDAGVRNTWVRVWTEEYLGQHGWTRHFIAASHKVRSTGRGGGHGGRAATWS